MCTPPIIGALSTSLSTLQGSELDIYGRRVYKGKELTQVYYIFMFFTFCAREKSEIKGHEEAEEK